MVTAIPLGQCIEVATHGMIERYPLMPPHHGAHQVRLVQPDACMLHLHQQGTAQLIIERVPRSASITSLAQLVLAAQAIVAHVVVLHDILFGTKQR